MSSGLATDSASSSSDERKSSASSPSDAMTGGTGGGASSAVDEIEVEASEEVRSAGVVGTADPRVRRFRRLLRSSWKRGPSQSTTCTASAVGAETGRATHFEGGFYLLFHLELGNLAGPPPRRVDLSRLGTREGLSPILTDDLVFLYAVDIALEGGLRAVEPLEALRASLCADEEAQLGFEGGDEEGAEIAGRDVFEGFVGRKDAEVRDERGAEGQVGQGGRDERLFQRGVYILSAFAEAREFPLAALACMAGSLGEGALVALSA